MNRILITGAAGKIGSTLRERLRGRYAVLRLSDIAPLDPVRAGEEIVRADLADLAEVEAAMRGVDCVVHLGAIPGEDTWDKILPNNVVGTWNVFEAARRQGVRRVIYASSHHAVGFYRRARFIDQMVVPRPDGVYGVSKVFRTHRSLDKDAPVSRPVQRTGLISSNAILGGLHHHYVRV